jgi:NAD(P)-dependent dehydrogenase (short-subunit alcohol dehydrogenase family)
MSGTFEGKVALVTGGGSGIGKECALLFARGGASVVVSDIVDDHGLGVVAEIEGMGGKAVFVKADVSKPEQVEAMVAGALEAFGRLDIAVNNAGIGGEAATCADYSVDGWRKVLSVNLDGVFYSMKYEIPKMLQTGGGAIVNIASILGLVGWATAPAYVAAKHGVVGLTKAAAIEFGQSNLRVNAVCPGFIDTPLLRDAGITPGDGTWEFIAGKHAMNRLGTPQEVAKLVAFLASDDASFLTGAPYLVDGGFVAQ